MRNLIFILTILPIVAFSQSVRFKKLKLYDVYEESPAKAAIGTTIFDDSKGTMWASLFDCGEFEITDEVAYTDKRSIKLSWNKDGCEWIGFGNSFNNWVPTDMSGEVYKKAFSMYVRTQSGTSQTIPFVLAMEDMSGGGSYHFISPDYVKGLGLDTTWKQVIVPLWHFPYLFDEEEFDIYSVKQMQFQLEGSGKFYIDDLKLIDFTEEEYQKMQDYKFSLKPVGEPNQKIYTEGQFEEDAWGIGKQKCYELEELKDSNNTYIKWSYNVEDCNLKEWGINWNGWYQANFIGLEKTSELKFKIKTESVSNFKIKLSDFNGHSSVIKSSSYIKSNSGEWTVVSIPLKEFELDKNEFVMDQIRQLSFIGVGKGTVLLDDIEIVEIK